MADPIGPIEILVTTDRHYAGHLSVMLYSLAASGADASFRVWILSRDLTEADASQIETNLRKRGIGNLVVRLIRVPEARMKHMPTSRRYPDSIYDRLFAPDELPEEVERVLYLDPDIVVLHSVRSLWKMPLEGCLIAAASHVQFFGCFLNRLRLMAWTPGHYVNSGVMLMDLKGMREDRSSERFERYARTHKACLCLPDQDILSAVYGRRILPIDPHIWNMTERIWRKDCLKDPSLTVSDVGEKTVIIHYIGRNKPWKKNYLGELDCFYKKTVSDMAVAAGREDQLEEEG